MSLEEGCTSHRGQKRGHMGKHRGQAGGRGRGRHVRRTVPVVSMGREQVSRLRVVNNSMSSGRRGCPSCRVPGSTVMRVGHKGPECESPCKGRVGYGSGSVVLPESTPRELFATSG